MDSSSYADTSSYTILQNHRSGATQERYGSKTSQNSVSFNQEQEELFECVMSIPNDISNVSLFGVEEDDDIFASDDDTGVELATPNKCLVGDE